MKRDLSRDLGLGRLRSRSRRASPVLRLSLLVGAAIMTAYLLWPYATLWRLDTAVRSSTPQNLVDLVDLAAVRSELKSKLNKDANSSIDYLSDPFILWLEEGIQAMGGEAVDRLVTLEWIREQLLTHSPPGPDPGFLSQITHAYFDAPDGFRLSIGPEYAHPVQVRLRLDDFSWRIAAVYY